MGGGAFGGHQQSDDRSFRSGWQTARDKPVEYGPSWEGFGKRYGMRLTGVATGNAMEAAIGSIWARTRVISPSVRGSRFANGETGDRHDICRQKAAMATCSPTTRATRPYREATFSRTPGVPDSEATTSAALDERLWCFWKNGIKRVSGILAGVKGRVFRRKD